MRFKFSGAFMLLGLLLLLFASAQTLFANTSPQMLVLKAVSENSAEAAPAIAELRALGPAGLDELFRTYSREIDQQVTHPLLNATPEWKRLSAALDEVSQQKDSYLSGLYWYTDFAQAKAAARAANKPILSLRLLGKLDEEFSCANSRFFRTILYSNAEVSKLLREKFILYWESERPVPKVTIDFGDGRKLERTLTGNSIHYVLDADGKVIDALPGLYGPGAFMRLLNQMEAVFREPDSKDRPAAPAVPYHRARLNATNVAWYADIQKTGGKIPVGLIVVEQNSEGQPIAISAAPYAMTKVFSEANMLKAIIGAPASLGTITDQATWNKIAQLHIADAQLDKRSLGLIQRQTQGALSSDGSDKNKVKAFAALTERLQQNIALDTVRNEYLLHTKLYSWLMVDKDYHDVKKLNAKVYSDLFLTPASDPWLGLFSPEVYTALEGGRPSTNRLADMR